MTGVEPVTSSLPRKRSTPELHRLVWTVPLDGPWSGRRDSNSRHSAWKADALPTELLPLISFCGESRIRTCEGKTNRFTVCPRWPLEYLPNIIRADGGIRTPDQLITNQLLWPTELHRQICWCTKKRTYSFPNCLILGLQMYETFFYHKLF